MNDLTLKHIRFVYGAAMSALAQGLGAVGSALFQHHLNRQDVEESREYMSPKMQASRLIEGGFNPARSLSQGAILSNQGQDIAPTDISASMASVSGVANATLQQKIADAQVRNVDADTELKKVQAGLTDAQRIAETFRNKILPDMLNKQLTAQDLDNAIKQLTQGLTQAETEQYIASANQIYKNMQLIDSQLEEYKYRIKSAENESVIAELRSKAEPQRIAFELVKQGIDNDNARLMGAEISATIRNIDKDTDIKDVEKRLNDVALKYADKLEGSKAEKAATESRTAKSVEEQTLMDTEVQREGHEASKYLAPFTVATHAISGTVKGIFKF